MENELNPFKVYFNPDFIKKVPQKAGVYFFHSSTGGLLYVGKAVNLRNRLRSYFQLKSNVGESKKVWRMLRLTKNITWEMCSTEEMAVLRENNYIRDLKPPFNVLNKNPHKYFVIFLKNPSLDNLSIELKTWGAFSNKILNKELGMGFGVFRSRRFTREAFFSLGSLLNFLTLSIQNGSDYFKDCTYKDSYRYNFQLEKSLLTNLQKWLLGESHKFLSISVKNINTSVLIDDFNKFRLLKQVDTLLDFYKYVLKNNNKMKKELNFNNHEVLSPETLDDSLSVNNIRKRKKRSNLS